MKGKLLLMHGGGPTAVINASLAGAIRKAYASGAFSSVVAARFGTGGLLREDLISLDGLTESELAMLSHTPGSAIGTGRDQLEAPEYRAMVEIMQHHGISAVVMNGGNGTMDTTRKLAQASAEAGILVAGIPKTMDNDLSGTDHSPGFGSAARYLAASVREVAQDVKGLPIHVVVIESFGRDAGWITASSAFARTGGSLDAPQMILLPEVAFDEERFLSRVKELHDKMGGVIVVASEGLRYADGTPIVDPVFKVGRSVYFGDVSAHLAQTITKKLGIKSRSEKPGILGRASALWASDVDREEAEACGERAVQAILEHLTGYMSTIFVINREPYRREIGLIKIDDSVLKAKKMPSHYYDAANYDVTDEFLSYARPLVGDNLGSFISFTDKEKIV